MKGIEIHKACREGNIEEIRDLIRDEPKLANAVDSSLGWTPLIRAVVCNHYNVAEELLLLSS